MLVTLKFSENSENLRKFGGRRFGTSPSFLMRIRWIGAMSEECRSASRRARRSSRRRSQRPRDRSCRRCRSTAAGRGRTVPSRTEPGFPEDFGAARLTEPRRDHDARESPTVKHRGHGEVLRVPRSIVLRVLLYLMSSAPFHLTGCGGLRDNALQSGDLIAL